MGCVGNQAQENCKLENELLLQRLCDLYVSFRRRYVLCLPSGAIFTPQRKNKQGYALLTNGVLRKHLLREYSVAIFAGGWGSKFVCFDVDDASAETVKKLLDCLEAFGFPRERIYVSFSGGKGYHVEIFFNQLVATEYLKRLYRWVIARGKFDPHKVEFRPTNTMAIKLPLSIHARTGKVCWYVDRETLAAIERVEYLMEIETLSASVLDELIAQNISGNEVPEETDETKSARIGHGGKATDESRNLGTKLTEAGTRHNMMRNIAIHKRYLGATSAQCRKELLDWYEQQDKDIVHSTREEVQEDIDELISWVYSDRFEQNYAQPKGEVLLNSTDAKQILSQRSRCARRIVFFLLTRCKARQYQINYAGIARAIGVSERTTIKTIQRLEKEGILEIEHGNRYSLGAGEFAAQSNRYGVLHERGCMYDRHHEIRIKDLMNDTTECYFNAMLDLLPQWVVEKALVREEREEYADFRAQHRDAKVVDAI